MTEQYDPNIDLCPQCGKHELVFELTEDGDCAICLSCEYTTCVETVKPKDYPMDYDDEIPF